MCVAGVVFFQTYQHVYLNEHLSEQILLGLARLLTLHFQEPVYFKNVGPNDFENKLPLLTPTSEESHTDYFFKASLESKG